MVNSYITHELFNLLGSWVILTALSSSAQSTSFARSSALFFSCDNLQKDNFIFLVTIKNEIFNFKYKFRINLEENKKREVSSKNNTKNETSTAVT